MGSLLSEYLSNSPKPIICNGKLLLFGNKEIRVRESATYSTVFTTRVRNNSSGQGEEVNLTTGEGLPPSMKEHFEPITEKSIISSVLDFERKYAAQWGQDPEYVDADSVIVEYDEFTRAIIIEGAIHRAMMDPVQFHRTDRTYDEAGRRIRAELLLDYINDYYTIFTRLFSHSLTSASMPFSVRAHFVAGLYQPLQCSTMFIRSPLDYPIFGGLRAIIKGDSLGITDELGNIEEKLNITEGRGRHLNVTCAAMYDIVRRFAPTGEEYRDSLVIPRELDRKVFMYILLYLMSGIVNSGVGLQVPLASTHPAMNTEMIENDVYRTFANNLITGFTEQSTKVAVI